MAQYLIVLISKTLPNDPDVIFCDHVQDVRQWFHDLRNDPDFPFDEYEFHVFQHLQEVK